MPSWNPQLYLKFATERGQAAIDLAARINLQKPARIIDLGCGTGNSTALLRQRWPSAELYGMDNSREMITVARESQPSEMWLEGDIGTWNPLEPYDLVFSNAALQWVPTHGELIPRLVKGVASGGAFAAQLPAHFKSPVHELMMEVADLSPWSGRMKSAKTAIRVERPGYYYDLMQPLCTRVEIWETEYNHVMDGPAAILEWIRGTGLRPFLEALHNEEERKEFESRYIKKLAAAYPRQRDDKVLFPFRRLFLLGYR